MNQGKPRPVWWHNEPEASMAPLDALRISADCLEAGVVVPAPAASLLARALRQYLAGKTDITGNLGLRPRRGGRHEMPLAVEKRLQRDEGIRELFEAQRGGKVERAKKVATLLAAPPDAELSAEGRVSESDVFRHLLQLHRDHAGDLPTSMRQVLRVVNRERG